MEGKKFNPYLPLLYAVLVAFGTILGMLLNNYSGGIFPRPAGGSSKLNEVIHYIDKNGVVQGVARVPLSEYYYHSAYRITAVGPDGEVYALLPRPDSLDVIRLNFYRELEPLMPEAVIPLILRLPAP